MAARRHWRFTVRDQFGFVIQNASVFVYQPGTSTAFTGTCYNAASGGSPITNPFTSNSQGEVEGWFDTAQVVDVLVTDNTDQAYRAIEPTVLLSFTSFTEADDIYVSASDIASAVGTSGDIVDIDPGDATAAGSTGRFADAGHQHENTADPNAHSHSVHSNRTRQLWFPVLDVVNDGGTVATRGTAPDALRVVTLADAASTGMSWAFVVPNDWVSGALTCQIYHAGQTTTGGAVRWTIDSISVAAASSVVAAGTSASFTGATLATADLLIKEAAQNLITPAAIGDLVRVNVRRIGADGADTYAASTSLIGILVGYTADM